MEVEILDSKELKELLIERRNKLDLSHQEVANLSGANISRQFYGMIENGERRPSPEVAMKLGKLLGIEWTIFFEVKGNERLRKRVAI